MNDTHKLEATVFVYSHKKTGRIQAHYIELAKMLENDVEWEHLATLEPRMWIECNYSIAKQRDELLAALEKMNRAYINLMENGRDRIVMLGGDCDPVDVMERSDPCLLESRALIASVKGGV